MALPKNKTKLVCTIGPASSNRKILERMIRAGMNVARLNFSHGDFKTHQASIDLIRKAAKSVGQRVAIMADLPGPKMRIGMMEKPIELKHGDLFTLTTEEITGNGEGASVTFKKLPHVVKPGNRLYLNDGLIHLHVLSVTRKQVKCKVLVGGELSSRKGLNLPGIDLGMSAFTSHDRECLKFAIKAGVDAISQSFVETAADIHALRKAAKAVGRVPFIIAKIERAGALDNIDSILDAADGIMIARGDLGVEIPIEGIARVQKSLMKKANLAGKPVITATQMLESMTHSRLPTRAEATDVANAILDGTDGVMLSAESAVGKYPVDAVAMLAKIAASIEPSRPAFHVRNSVLANDPKEDVPTSDIIAVSVEAALERVAPIAVVVPSKTGTTARSIARFRPPVWILAVSSREQTCQALCFSYGVEAFYRKEDPDNWNRFIREKLKERKVKGNMVVLAAGPSEKHPDANIRMEIIDLRKRR